MVTFWRVPDSEFNKTNERGDVQQHHSARPVAVENPDGKHDDTKRQQEDAPEEQPNREDNAQAHDPNERGEFRFLVQNPHVRDVDDGAANHVERETNRGYKEHTCAGTIQFLVSSSLEDLLIFRQNKEGGD